MCALPNDDDDTQVSENIAKRVLQATPAAAADTQTAALETMRAQANKHASEQVEREQRTSSRK